MAKPRFVREFIRFLFECLRFGEGTNMPCLDCSEMQRANEFCFRLNESAT